MGTRHPVWVAFAIAASCAGQADISTTSSRPPGGPLPVSQQASLARRKSAEQIVSVLKTQLDLTDNEIFGGRLMDPPPELYSARSSDAIPLISPRAESNYFALGGPSWLNSKKASVEPSTVFVQQLAPLSQAWCRLSVRKSRTPLLLEASLSDSTSTPQGRDRIRRNLARQHVRMLGEAASDADLSDLMDLFQVYERNGAEAAWTAVCAALVRHPLWITF